jgi:hypothetical protein
MGSFRWWQRRGGVAIYEAAMIGILSKGRHVMRQSVQAGAPRFLGEEFNPFLFAFIGTDRYGSQLSVVSALARLDLDAWAEAAMLARLPRDVAANKLSARLRKFTEIPQIVQDSGIIAARLIALLPQRGAVQNAAIAKPGGLAADRGAIGFVVLATLAFLLCLQYFNHTAHAPLTPVAASATSAPLASAAARPTGPPP